MNHRGNRKRVAFHVRPDTDCLIVPLFEAIVKSPWVCAGHLARPLGDDGGDPATIGALTRKKDATMSKIDEDDDMMVVGSDVPRLSSFSPTLRVRSRRINRAMGFSVRP